MLKLYQPDCSYEVKSFDTYGCIRLYVSTYIHSASTKF